MSSVFTWTVRSNRIMSSIQFHIRLSALILPAMLLFGCNDSQTVMESGQTRAVTISAETEGATRDPEFGESEPEEESSAPIAIPQERKPLDLSADTAPGQRQEPSQNHSDPYADDLLPDLFTSKKDKEPVSVKGQLLMKQGAEDLSNSIDGAGVSIQFNRE